MKVFGGAPKKITSSRRISASMAALASAISGALRSPVFFCVVANVASVGEVIWYRGVVANQLANSSLVAASRHTQQPFASSASLSLSLSPPFLPHTHTHTYHQRAEVASKCAQTVREETVHQPGSLSAVRIGEHRLGDEAVSEVCWFTAVSEVRLMWTTQSQTTGGRRGTVAWPIRTAARRT